MPDLDALNGRPVGRRWTLALLCNKLKMSLISHVPPLADCKRNGADSHSVDDDLRIVFSQIDGLRTFA